MSNTTRPVSARTLTLEVERLVLLGRIGKQYCDIFDLCRREVQPLAVLQQALSRLTELSVSLQQSDGLIWELRERAEQFDHAQDKASAWVEVVIASGQEEDFRVAIEAIAAIENDPLEKLVFWLRMVERSDFLEDSIKKCFEAINECGQDESAFEEDEYPCLELAIAVLKRDSMHWIRRQAVVELERADSNHHDRDLAYIEICDLSGEYYKQARRLVLMETDLIKRCRLLCCIAARTGTRVDFVFALEMIQNLTSEEDQENESLLEYIVVELVEGIAQHQLCKSGTYVTRRMIFDLIETYLDHPGYVLRAKMAMMVYMFKVGRLKEGTRVQSEIEQHLYDLRSPEKPKHTVHCLTIKAEMQRHYVVAQAAIGRTKRAMKAFKRIGEGEPKEQLKALAAIARAQRLAKEADKN